jgi:hypothetical protein
VRGTANFQRAKPRSYPERFAVEAQNLVLFENKEFDCAAVGVSVAVLQFHPELMRERFGGAFSAAGADVEPPSFVDGAHYA